MPAYTFGLVEGKVADSNGESDAMREESLQIHELIARSRAAICVPLLIAGAALSACGRDAAPADGQRVWNERAAFEARIQERAKYPLDAPLTQDNSVLFTFEDGLRMEKFIREAA